MNRRSLALTFLVTPFVLGAGALAKQPARAAISARYLQIDDATRGGDTRSFAVVLAEGYEEYDLQDRLQKRSEVIEKFNAFFGRQKRDFVTKIVSFTSTADSAKVVCNRIDNGEKIFWRRTDLWRYAAGAWQLSQSRVDGFGVVRKGRLKFVKRRSA